MFIFNDVINRLKESLGVESNKEVYDLMGVSQQVFANWKARNKIPFEELTKICYEKKLDIKYILYNEKNENILNEIDYINEIEKKLRLIDKDTLKYMYHTLEAEILKNKKNK